MVGRHVNGIPHGYKPAREYDEISFAVCGGEIDADELDEPDRLTSDPAFVHWGCL